MTSENCASQHLFWLPWISAIGKQHHLTFLFQIISEHMEKHRSCTDPSFHSKKKKKSYLFQTFVSEFLTIYLFMKEPSLLPCSRWAYLKSLTGKFLWVYLEIQVEYISYITLTHILIDFKTIFESLMSCIESLTIILEVVGQFQFLQHCWTAFFLGICTSLSLYDFLFYAEIIKMPAVF